MRGDASVRERQGAHGGGCGVTAGGRRRAHGAGTAAPVPLPLTRCVVSAEGRKKRLAMGCA